MGIPAKFLLEYGSDEEFNWGPIVDGDQYNALPSVLSYTNDATVTITLYSGRSATNPATTPGTPVTNFSNLTVPYVTNSTGLYQLKIAKNIIPVPGQYTLVIDSVRASDGATRHFEIPTEVYIGAGAQ